MLHLLIALFAAYLLCCYAWGLFVTVRLLRSGWRRVRGAERDTAPLRKITPQHGFDEADRRRAA